MARYTYIDTNPKCIPVDLAAQLLPGTFEHALNHCSITRWTCRTSMRGFRMM